MTKPDLAAERPFTSAPERRASLLPAALVLAVGLVGAAAITALYLPAGLAKALVSAQRADRSVSVKGAAERNVEADLAIWELRLVASGNDLAAVQAKLEADRQATQKFLLAAGLPAAQISIGSTDVVDLLAQQYRDAAVAATTRFYLTSSVLVRSDAASVVETAQRNVGDLIKQGVIFTTDGLGQGKPLYLFTKLNDIKTEMLAEAVSNAKAAAAEFASQSGAQVGGILRANQGQFSILPADKVEGVDESRTRQKTVRVVSTLDYWLE